MENKIILRAATHGAHVHLDHGVGAADDQYEQVRDAEVEEEEVGGGAHRLGGQNHDQHQHVPHHPHRQHQAEHRGANGT